MRQWKTEFRKKQKFVDKTCETKGVHESQSCQSEEDKYKVEVKRCFMKSEQDHVRPYELEIWYNKKIMDIIM